MSDTSVIDEADTAENNPLIEEVENPTGDMNLLWQMLLAKVNELDETIDSWDPSKGLRNQFLKDLLAENAEDANAQASKVLDSLKAIGDDRTRYSLYLAYVGAIQDAMQKEANTWVDAQVEAMPKPEAVTVTPEEKKQVSSARSHYYTLMKQLYDVATGFKFPFTADWELPKIRRIGSGKRGKAALTFYNWFIDGVALEGDDNSPAGVATKLGFAKKSDLTKALKGLPVKSDDGKDQKLNTTKPPREFEVTLNGKLVTAVRFSDADVEDADEDDDEDDETDED